MTELVLKGKIDRKKLDSIVNFLRSWDIDVEIKESATKEEGENTIFSESFGMWADRDIDVKAIRQMTRERRTKMYGDDSL